MASPQILGAVSTLAGISGDQVSVNRRSRLPPAGICDSVTILAERREPAAHFPPNNSIALRAMLSPSLRHRSRYNSSSGARLETAPKCR